MTTTELEIICSILEHKRGRGAYICSIKILFEVGLNFPIGLSKFNKRLTGHGHKHHERSNAKDIKPSISSLCKTINRRLLEVGVHLEVMGLKCIGDNGEFKHGDIFIFLTESNRKDLSGVFLPDGINVRMIIYNP